MHTNNISRLSYDDEDFSYEQGKLKYFIIFMPFLCIELVEIKSKNSELTIIDQRFESDQLSDYEKIQKINELLNKYQNENKSQMKYLFDYETFISILNKLQSLSTPLELALLNIIEIIAKCISPFYSDIGNQEPTKKYESLFKSKIIEEEKRNQNGDNSYSLLIEQLLRIYFYIMKHNKINENLIVLFTIIIIRNISSLIKQIQIQDNQESMILNNDKSNIDVEIKIQSMIKTLSAFEGSQLKNDECLINSIKFHVIISSIIHLNCSEQFQCPTRIKVICSPTLILQLQKPAYKILLNFYTHRLDDEYLFNEQRAFQYFISIFISFNETNSFNHQLVFSDQQQYQNSLLKLNKATVYFLFNILIGYKPSNQSILHNQVFINSLIKMNNYQLNEYINEQTTKYSNKIKQFIQSSLNSIQDYGDEYTQQLLCQVGYAISLAMNLGSAGGYYLLNEQSIQQQLSNLTVFLIVVFEGNKYGDGKDQPKLKQQLHLFKEIEEQLEDFGLIEEIESKYQTELFQEDKAEWDYFAKESLLNVYLDISND